MPPQEAPDTSVQEGTVVALLPNAQYKIQLDSGEEVLAYTSGKMRLHKIRVLIGNRVQVKLDPYKGTVSNRVIRRL